MKCHCLGLHCLPLVPVTSTQNEKVKYPYSRYVFITVFLHMNDDVVNVQTGLIKGAQWLSGRVLDSKPKGRGFEPHRRHCVVVLEQDTFILA